MSGSPLQYHGIMLLGTFWVFVVNASEFLWKVFPCHSRDSCAIGIDTSQTHSRYICLVIGTVEMEGAY